MNPIRGPCGQRGVALVIGMVILVIMTLTVLSAVTMSTSNVKATSNMQFRDAAFAAANVAVEQVVSTDFMDAPTAVTVDVDMDQDGTNDYVVQVPEPGCTWWRIKNNSELVVTKAEDTPCYSGSRLRGVGGTSPSSFCADTMWEVRAPVEDTTTGAELAVNQGISVRMSVDLARNACD
jgi:hypothetical protein